MTLSLLWGKARPNLKAAPAGPAMHPLVAHVLDVAAVGMLLPDAGRLGLDRRCLGFLLTLHDIGKISRSFQAQAPVHWPQALLGPPPVNIPGFPHDAMGLHLLLGPLQASLRTTFLADRRGRRSWADPLLHALAGHHGRPAHLSRSPGNAELGPAAVAAAETLVTVMLDVFRPPPLCPPATDRSVQCLSWKLAGSVTLADWIGSRQEWFPYVTSSLVDDPADYLWNHALPRAARAINAAGLSVTGTSPFTGVRRLFPGIHHPTPVQSWAEQAPLPPGPLLAVIEDLTGSGKTEAALVLAHRLMAGGCADGLFLALPTMATANAMFGRLAEAYHRLFPADARPSLALAHGRAHLDPRFRATIPREDAAEALLRGKAPSEPADEPAEAHCAAWLADDRRRVLLAQVGIGTIDQALLAVLPVRHAVLRQRGLAGKVLIVDEAHAFDAYMNRELRALLSFHAALGGSAILLSATLPRAVRQGLVDAFHDGLGAPRAMLDTTTYPLATLTAATGTSETPCAPREDLPRRVAVSRLPDEGAAIARITTAAQAGAAVVWVRNTVDEAIAAAAALRARGLSPLLFHARFAMADRLRVEAEVLRRFGRDADPAERPGVLVATQVVEQSLDLDFDLLCTDLAPMDLLIQRAGRLWRHERGQRPVEGPELLVVSPEPVDEPAAGWLREALPGTAAVYRDPALLWRTARAVFGRGAIVTPGDMRPLIEEAYDREAPGAVPPALARAAQEAEGKAHSASGVAAQNVLELAKGYRREAGLWEPDTHTPTRLEERKTVVLRLARLRDGAVVPYDEDPDLLRAWALSEVSVARYRVASCPIPPGLEAAAVLARAGWSRWERESPDYLLAVLREGEQIAAVSEAGGMVMLSYCEDLGLIWTPTRNNAPSLD
jgi:CRISPR-associated endonuclease/helicase Cas3